MQEKHVSNAAKKLNISQSAASKLLNQLREAFDDPLLIRAESGLKLTEYALELHQKTLVILKEMEELFILNQDFDPKTFDKVIKIGIANSIADVLLTKLHQTLKSESPQARLDILSLDTKVLNQKISHDEISMAITYPGYIPEQCKTAVLFKDEPVCMARQGHPLLKQDAINIRDYLKYEHVVIIYDELSSTTLGDRVLMKHGFAKRKIKVTTRSPLTAMSLIANTDMLLTITKSFALQFHRNFNLQYRPFSIKVDHIPIYLVWSETFESSPWHSWLRKQIKDIFR